VEAGRLLTLGNAWVEQGPGHSTLLGYGCTVGMVGCGGMTTVTSQVVPTVQEEVVYLEGKVNSA
jgi:hypothetical protein